MNRDDYPGVKYWTQKSWAKKPDSHGNRDVGRSLKHLEHDDGSLLSTLEGTRIRETARRALNQIQVNNSNALPEKWSQAGLDLLRALCAELRKEHHVFGLCDGDWKAKTFLSEYYPDWTRSRRNKNDRVKQEDSEGSKTSSRKRDSEELEVEDTQITKKAKREDNGPAMASSAKGERRMSKPKVRP